MNPPRPNTGGGGGETPLQSLNEVRKMLQSFRAPQAGGGAPSASESATPSFQDLLKNSAALRPDAGSRSGFDGLGAIRNSLKNVPRKQPPRSSTPFLSPHAHSNIFSNERDGKTAGSRKEDKDSGMMLTRSYSYEDLGKRLGELRPANVAKDGKEWFSLEELQGRIAKLAKLEEQDDQLGGSMSDIRKSIMNFKNAGVGSRVAAPVPMALLGNIGGQSMLDYMRLPPQEELLERVRLTFAILPSVMCMEVIQ
jgi:hypothetical protein